MNHEMTLRGMSVALKELAEWAVVADKYEVAIVNEELGKLITHLKTARIVQDATALPDLMDDAELKTDA